MMNGNSIRYTLRTPPPHLNSTNMNSYERPNLFYTPSPPHNFHPYYNGSQNFFRHQSPNMSPVSFNRSPNMPPGNFNRSPNMSHGNFNRSPNMSPGNFNRSPNMSPGNFSRSPSMSYNRSPNMPPGSYISPYINKQIQNNEFKRPSPSYPSSFGPSTKKARHQGKIFQSSDRNPGRNSNIRAYYHPSMVEDPWKELIAKHEQAEKQRRS